MTTAAEIKIVVATVVLLFIVLGLIGGLPAILGVLAATPIIALMVWFKHWMLRP